MSPWHPHVTVAVVVECEGRFLIVEEEAVEGRVFNQPAGHLEAGETLAQAAVRETREETGYRVELDGVVGLALYTSPANGLTYHRTTFFSRSASPVEGAQLDPEILAVHWLTEAEIRARSDRMRSPLVIASIEQYLAGQHWPLDVIYYTQ